MRHPTPIEARTGADRQCLGCLQTAWSDLCDILSDYDAQKCPQDRPLRRSIKAVGIRWYPASPELSLPVRARLKAGKHQVEKCHYMLIYAKTVLPTCSTATLGVSTIWQTHGALVCAAALSSHLMTLENRCEMTDDKNAEATVTLPCSVGR